MCFFFGQTLDGLESHDRKLPVDVRGWTNGRAEGARVGFQLSYEVLESASWRGNRRRSLPMQTGLLVHRALTQHWHS